MIDETSFSRGELYTVLTNKAAKRGKGSIVAIIAGTKAETVIEIIRKIPEVQRKKVTEITLDMADSIVRMNSYQRGENGFECFTKLKRAYKLAYWNSVTSFLYQHD